MKKLIVKLLIATVLTGAIAVVVVILLPPRAIEVIVPGHGQISVESPSFLRSLLGATNRIIYRENGVSGDIMMWQDLTSRPVFFEALPNTNAFLCLYDWDGDLRLMRINPNKKFTPSEATKDDVATNVVCSSPWEVRNATVQDWREIEAYLTNSTRVNLASQVLHQFPVSFYPVRRLASLIAGVQMRERLMTEYGAGTWPMLVTSRYPIGVTNGH